MAGESTVQTDRRIYRTADGRLVWQGDPDAAFLAHPAGRDVPRSVLDEVSAKQSKPARNKQAAKTADKSGLTVTRRRSQSPEPEDSGVDR